MHNNNIGYINAINTDFIVVKIGFVNIHYYYIPIIHVEGLDSMYYGVEDNEEKVKEEIQLKEVNYLRIHQDTM